MPVLAPLLFSALLIAAELASSQQREPAERPGPRAHHWLVYDEGLRSVLLCGGSTAAGDDAVFYDDVWSFDGAGWTRVGALVRPESGLRAVSRPGGGIVAFGGFRANGRAVGQLREWDGEAWNVLDPAADKAVAECGFALDVGRARFVLFGGSGSGGHRGTTWEWDGAAWQSFDVAAPPARSTHGMVHDARRGRTLLFGGTNGSRLGDTWEWDGSTWTELPGPGPSARLAPGMAYDAARVCTVLFGGAGASGGLGDTWIHDGVRWRELRIPGPSPRISPPVATRGRSMRHAAWSCSSAAAAPGRTTSRTRGCSTGTSGRKWRCGRGRGRAVGHTGPSSARASGRGTRSLRTISPPATGSTSTTVSREHRARRRGERR